MTGSFLDAAVEGLRSCEGEGALFIEAVCIVSAIWRGTEEAIWVGVVLMLSSFLELGVMVSRLPRREVIRERGEFQGKKNMIQHNKLTFSKDGKRREAANLQPRLFTESSGVSSRQCLGLSGRKLLRPLQSFDPYHLLPYYLSVVFCGQVFHLECDNGREYPEVFGLRAVAV